MELLNEPKNFKSNESNLFSRINTLGPFAYLSSQQILNHFSYDIDFSEMLQSTQYSKAIDRDRSDYVNTTSLRLPLIVSHF